MKTIRYIAVAVLGCLSVVAAKAERWTTHFAYNNVTQIAMSPECVYAISDGSLFSVDKQSERIRVYNSQSGLHGTGITCIHYDEAGRQLIVCYANGKIDIMHGNGVKYIGELYDKDMTQKKTIYNVTIHGRTAYLSTHYGVQTLDLRENKPVDSYWLRPNGEETPVKDVLIANDSIYAFTEDSLFCAAMATNLVDYTVWRREQRSGRISPDTEKGIHYTDNNDQWYAGKEEGVVRFTPTERINYKPQGPLSNIPYRITATQGRVWVLQGGRWSAQYGKPGIIMIYDGKQWKNITDGIIVAKTGRPALDFMNVAVDPADQNHYFVTSYGTGLYEFRNDTVVRQEIAGGATTLQSAASEVEYYTRVDYAQYDKAGRLWMLNAGNISYQLQCMDKDNTWHGIALYVDNAIRTIPTPGGLIFDKNNARYKWIAAARSAKVGVYLHDDNGTMFDSSDDRTQYRHSWTNQHGQTFEPTEIYEMIQDKKGRIWLVTNAGAAYIRPEVDFFESDAIVQPDIMDNNGENPITSLSVQTICQTPDGSIWLGTNTLGVYVLDEAATEIIQHYTTENSVLPDNGIMSLACDEEGRVYIGTAEGLVEYDPNAAPEGLNGYDDGEEDLNPGTMQQWRLHLSYSDPQELAATPQRIFAAANGSLFSVNRQDEQIEYWSKSTGLTGNTVAHIAYDPASEYLVVTYMDGRIDLLDKEGAVRQMPDLYMKAGSVSATINSITVGSRYTYLAMPFGIVALQPHKGEVSDTYYIGDEAGSVNVQQIVEFGDSLFAFGEDGMYSASLQDNLVDYSYWHRSAIPTDRLQSAAAHQNSLYTLQHDSLYRWETDHWNLVRPEAFAWMREASGQMFLYVDGQCLYRLGDDDQLIGMTKYPYQLHDALLSNGEYWLAEKERGLIRLGHDGDDYFHPEGPNSNTGYCMYAVGSHIYSAIGGRWAGEYARYARINIFDGVNWLAINNEEIGQRIGFPARDPVSIAVDPNDAGHFFVATYGTGVFEFRNYQAYKQYTTDTIYHSTTLREATYGIDARYYTRTDGAMLDEFGNLWVLNATSVGSPVHIMTPAGQWFALNMRIGGANFAFNTPGAIWVDRRSTRWKWMINQRKNPGIILLDDGGTPTEGYDDQYIMRSTFTDQNGNSLSPTQIRCLVQDHTNRLWIGTEKGIILIPSTVDFFASNACRRIIIPRNDGTGLGDYLLGDEQINCMAVDGGNRLWIGTANSGLYLIEDDTITVAHFTETNSLLPSNAIQSIAIMPATGEVFVGTDYGIASYRSDSSEPNKDMSGAYAYPNPVRPDYGGMISITGLMENTVVNIVDAGGNLVCKTRSNGGTAVWDGRLPDGRRATPGVYTALCNSAEGHAAVKILVVR